MVASASIDWNGRGRVAVALLVVLAAAGCAGRAGSSAPAPAPVHGAPQSVSCVLQAPAHVGLDQPVVPVTFVLHNAGSADVRVLARHTPLEGILGDLFDVTRAGHRLAYRGRMVKRGPPEESEFVTLAPGDHVRATVDLLEGYDLTQAGEYAVRFVGTDGYACNELLITRN